MSDELFMLDVVRPEWYGAVADGVTDCLEAFNDAVAHGARRIQLSQGTYYLSDRLSIDFTTAIRRPITITGNGSVLLRRAQDAVTAGDLANLNSIIYINNPPEYATTVTEEIPTGAHKITVASTANIATGDIVRIASTESYAWTSGLKDSDGGTEYLKSICGKVVAVDDATHFTIDIAIPFMYWDDTAKMFKERAFLVSGETVTVYIWKRTTWCNVNVENVRLEWDALTYGGTDRYTVGIASNYNHVSRYAGLQFNNISGCAVWQRSAYGPLVQNCVARSEVVTTPGAEYGIENDGIAVGIISNCVIHTNRHAVGFTGFPSVYCQVIDSVLCTNGAASGYSFNSHCAEDVTVQGCFLNDGAKFAGARYRFLNCEIHTRLNHAAGVFQKRSTGFLRELVVKNCRIHKWGGKPGVYDHPGVLFNAALSVTRGTTEFGSIVIADNEIHNHSGAVLSYQGDGTTTDFAVPFYVASSSGFYVYLRDSGGNDTLQTLATHYSAVDAGTSPSTTKIRFVTAPAATQKVIITYSAMELLWFGNWKKVGGVKATGTITCVAKSDLVNNDYFTVPDGVHPAGVIFEYKVNSGTYVPVSGRITVDISSGATTAADVATATANAINAVTYPLLVTASSLNAVVTVTNNYRGTHGNVTITENVANAGFSVSGFSGGVNAPAGPFSCGDWTIKNNKCYGPMGGWVVSWPDAGGEGEEPALLINKPGTLTIEGNEADGGGLNNNMMGLFNKINFINNRNSHRVDNSSRGPQNQQCHCLVENLQAQQELRVESNEMTFIRSQGNQGKVVIRDNELRHQIANSLIRHNEDVVLVGNVTYDASSYATVMFDLDYSKVVTGRNVSRANGVVPYGGVPTSRVDEDDTLFKTFSANDTSPSVRNGTNFKTANTSPTTISMLDDGHNGQTIRVVINDANTTIDFTGTNLKGNSGVNWSPASGDFMDATFDGTNWYCDVHDTTA